MPRPLPSTIEELRVPNPDYPYLLEAHRFPFHAGRSTFDLAIAWWLAEISFLVYLKDAARIRDVLRAAGLPSTTFFERRDSFAILTEDGGKRILAFRGTSLRSLENLLADVDVKLTTFENGPARVHRGFLRALDLVWKPIAAALGDPNDARPLYVTGHSLGAAMATLTAARHPRFAALYTFGSPRVGDRVFRDRFPMTRSLRVVNEHDLVTELPPPVRYRHVGHVIHLRGDGKLEDGTTPWERLRHNVTERIPGIFRDASDLREVWGNVVRENALSDHAPINYALRLWNLLDGSA